MTVGPGAYLLAAPGRAFPASVGGPAFVAPPSSTAPPTAFAEWPRQWREGVDLDFRATVAAAGDLPVTLHVRPAGSPEFTSLFMRREASYRYGVRVTGKLLTPGVAESYLSLGAGAAAVNLPGGDTGDRAVLTQTAPPIELLHPGEGTALPEASYSGPEGKGARVTLVPGREAGQQALRLEADGFGPEPSAASMRPAVGPLPSDLRGYDALRLVLRGGPETSQVEVTLVQSDGQAFGINVLLGPVWSEVTLPLGKLQPRWGTTTTTPDLAKLQAVAFVTGAWILGEARARPHAVEVASAALVRKALTWELEVAPAAGPVVLVRPADVRLTPQGRPAQWRTVAGMDPGRTALQVKIDGFGPEPDCVGWRIQLPQFPASERPAMAAAHYVIFKARGTEPQTNKFELVLLEEDGSPWGVGSVPLTTQWQEIRLPIDSIAYFKQWGLNIKNRGGPGDRFHPENAQAVNFCFGAWLYGDQRAKPHGVEIQEVSLAQ